MVSVYSWSKQVERKTGENVKAAARELRLWAEGAQESEKASKSGKALGTMIAVYMPEQADQVLGCQLAPDGRKIPGTEVTLREAYPLMCPAEGQAVVYISDMSLDLPQEVLSKAAELFDKHGVLDVWSSILRDGYDGLVAD